MLWNLFGEKIKFYELLFGRNSVWFFAFIPASYIVAVMQEVFNKCVYEYIFRIN